MAEATSQLFQSEYPLVVFFDAHCGLQGIYDSYAYHHQIQPANETWMDIITKHYNRTIVYLNNTASFS